MKSKYLGLLFLGFVALVFSANLALAFSFHVGVAGGSNTQVLFNDSGQVAGDAGMVYNKTTDTLTITNLIGTAYGSDGSVSDTELKYINTLSSNAQTQIDTNKTVTLKASELNDTSDPHLLTTAEMKDKIITNSESVGADEWDAPAKTKAWCVIFMKEVDQNMAVDPNGTEQWNFRNDNSAYSQLAAGEAIVNTTAGKSTLACFSTEAGVFCTGDANWAEETP